MLLIAVFLGIEFASLFKENKELRESIINTEYIPSRYIMIGAKRSGYIASLATMTMNAHNQAEIGIKCMVCKEEEGYMRTFFENGDELLVYQYEKAPIEPLKQHERDEFCNKIFIDYKLPQGAERAIIEQLGLMDYMVNIGICSEKGGKQ